MTPLPDRDAAFTARIAADATHEMRNVLAIVKESAGLMGDILEACAGGTQVDPARMERALSRIDTQVGRGADLMTHLNRFAHSLEGRRESIDLDREVEQAVFLGRRSARKHRITLSCEPGGSVPTLIADSFHVQMAIAEAVEWWLPQLPEEARLRLRPVDAGGRAAVEITGETGAGDAVPSPATSHLWDDLLSLEAEMATVPEATRAGMRLLLSGATQP